jgi:hypothetical protein
MRDHHSQVIILFKGYGGSYSVKINAENQVQKLKNAGFDVVIMVVK